MTALVGIEALREMVLTIYKFCKNHLRTNSPAHVQVKCIQCKGIDIICEDDENKTVQLSFSIFEFHML